MKRQISFIFVLISIIFLIPITAYAQSTKTVTDMNGKKVQIPPKVTRVADLWHANNQVVLLLGGQKKIVATTPLIKKQHWFVVVDPAIKKVVSPFAGDQIQVEELLKTKPDVVIAAQPGQLKAARQAKLPAVNAMYNNFSGLKKSVNLTAQVLGGNAPQVAKKYNRLLDHNISYVQQRLSETHRRPTVVHFVNAKDLTKVDGRKTIVDQWIKIAGGKNAISKPGNQITVNNEELLKEDPDVIIVGSCSTKQARAVVSVRMPKGSMYMYHAQDNEIYEPLSTITGNRGGSHNAPTQIHIKPTHMVGGYGQLSYAWNYYGPTGNQRDLYVNVRKLKKVNWSED